MWLFVCICTLCLLFGLCFCVYLCVCLCVFLPVFLRRVSVYVCVCVCCLFSTLRLEDSRVSS